MQTVSRETWVFDRDLKDLHGNVRNAVRSIALAELNNQVRLGNDTFVVTTDGRRGKGVGQVQRKVQIDFATFALPAAVRDIEARVRRLTPRRTGRLLKSWRWELNGAPVDPQRLSQFGAGDTLRYVNLQPYIRKAVSRYGARSRRRVRRGRRGQRETVTSLEPLTQRVTRLVRRRYRGLRISHEWVDHPGFSKPLSAKDGRIPTVTIRLARGLLQA